MPYISVSGHRMHNEIYGAGEPVALIGGLSNDPADYTERSTIVPALARTFSVLAFDNRGVGRTEKPDVPYSIELMATDTVGLMQAVGIERAHVIGISMGGRIALELALRYPAMVNKLVLVSTGARVAGAWRRTMLHSIARLRMLRGSAAQPYYAFARQSEPSAAYECTARLPELRSPTLILHGKRDRVAPYALAKAMQALIPNATMQTFDGGHIFLLLNRPAWPEHAP